MVQATPDPECPEQAIEIREARLRGGAWTWDVHSVPDGTIRIFDADANPLSGDVERTDWVVAIARKLNEQMVGLQTELKAMREAEKRIKKMIGRFRRDGEEDNPLAQVVVDGLRGLGWSWLQ